LCLTRRLRNMPREDSPEMHGSTPKVGTQAGLTHEQTA